MPKIIINEKDLTSESTTIDVNDIAYIPGLSILDPSDDTYVLGEPTFITTIEEFERRFGNRPFSFADDIDSGEFSQTTRYKTYDVVKYDGGYFCLYFGLDQAEQILSDVSVESITEWSSSTNEYAKNTVVTKNGLYYLCIKAITSASAIPPEDDNEHWTLLYTYTTANFGDYYYSGVGTTISVYKMLDNTIPAYGRNSSTNTIVEWDSTVASYAQRFMVSYNGVIYANKRGTNTTTPPDEDTTNWTTNGVIYPTSNDYCSYDVDSGYLYASTMLNLGLPIYYEVVDAGAGTKCQTISQLYYRFEDHDDAASIFEKIADKGSYSIKYITTGGYPIYKDTTTNMISKILECAAKRGDAVAYIDHIQGLSANPVDETNPFNTIRTLDTGFTVSGVDVGSYGVMYTPWNNYKLETTYDVGDGTKTNEFILPASFYYLTCLATSLRNNPAWLAIAGVTRGRNSLIDQKGQKPTVTNKEADAYQTEGGTGIATEAGRSINAITNIRPYGLTIWGNRTLYKNVVDKTTPALGYLNIRLMVCDVKKAVFSAAQKWMFEPNDDVLWINFQSSITPLLDKMSTSGGLSGYKIIKQKSNHGSKLCATIILYPIYAVETIEVTIELRNEEITVE